MYGPQRGGEGCITVLFDLVLVAAFAVGVWFLIRATNPFGSQSATQGAAVATTQTATPIPTLTQLRADFATFTQVIQHSKNSCLLTMILTAEEVQRAQDVMAQQNLMDHIGAVCSAAASTLQQTRVPADLIPFGVAQWRDNSQQVLAGMAHFWRNFVSSAVAQTFRQEESTLAKVKRAGVDADADLARILRRLGLPPERICTDRACQFSSPTWQGKWGLAQ